MIAIPNMEKPKNCYACSFNDGIFCALIDNDTDAFIKENPTEVATKVLDDCPLIDIVRCKDCKHYDTESRSFPCCTDIFGAVRYMEADGFCSKGERRADEHKR